MDVAPKLLKDKIVEADSSTSNARDETEIHQMITGEDVSLLKQALLDTLLRIEALERQERLSEKSNGDTGGRRMLWGFCRMM